MRYRPICRNIEYARVYRRGKSYVAPQLVLYVCKNRLGRTRVGFTARATKIRSYPPTS